MTGAFERAEELAKQFRKDTGLMAPFKDAPAAVGGDPEYDQSYRQREYDKWLQEKSPVSDCQCLNCGAYLTFSQVLPKQILDDIQYLIREAWSSDELPMGNAVTADIRERFLKQGLLVEEGA